MPAHRLHNQWQPPRPRSRPTLVYGGTCGPFGGAQRAIRQAQNDGYLAIDLDLRNAFISPSATALQALAETRTLRVRSIWLPPRLSGPFLARRLERLTTLIRLAQVDLGLRHIIIAGASQAATRHGTPLLPVAQRAVAEIGGSVRLTLGVRADRAIHSLEGPALALRVAEEWDLDLALDVAGPVPAGWEVEAAILRMLPRLTVVRLCGWLPTQYSVVDEGPTRIAARSMSMLTDQGFAGVLSMVPTRNRRLLSDYQHDLQRRYDIGSYSTDIPTRTSFDLP